MNNKTLKCILNSLKASICKYIFLTFFYCLSLPIAQAKETLNIGFVGYNSETRESLYLLADEFTNKYPNTEIKFFFKKPQKYKSTLEYELKNNNLDIFYWHAGQRLDKYIRNGLITPITDIWNTHQLANNFSASMTQHVTMHNDVYALPISYYQWGMLYNKKLFQRFSLTPPQTWQEFIYLLEKLKQQALIPIFLGAKDTYNVSIWFEYFYLRLNGIESYQQFIQGEVPSSSRHVRQVLHHFKQVIDSTLIHHYPKTTLLEGLPLIYREKAGIMLAPSFYSSYMSGEVKKNIGFFPFPTLNNKTPNYEVSPSNVMFISKNAKQTLLAKKFIVFLASKKSQEQINLASHFLSPNKFAKAHNNSIQRDVKFSLENATDLTLFYDRETEKHYGENNMLIWRDFLKNTDIQQTINKMEKVRLTYLQQTKD